MDGAMAGVTMGAKRDMDGDGTGGGGLAPHQDPARLAALLLAHYDRHGRDLPWRGERDLYRIWVSEIMLQQTTVGAVIPYYQRFLDHFPTVTALAAAAQEAVLHQWQGLGYYSRARNLHRAAGEVVARHGGRLPEERAALESLPGIGRSTAAAILAIGRERREAILDGNVKRVLSRLLALEEPPDTPAARQRLWAAAAALTPAARPGDYAQAIMDLGATLCTRTRPGCPRCPWGGDCRAHAGGDPAGYPRKKAPRARPRRNQLSVLLLDEGGRLLLRRRPPEGLLGGMWQPLSSPAAAHAPREPLAWLRREWAIQARLGGALPPLEHVFTHFHLTVRPFLCHLTASFPPPDAASLRWVTPREAQSLPLATLDRKILAHLPAGRGW